MGNNTVPATQIKDTVIPVRIMCTEKDIEKIMKFTKEHYKQEALLALKVSEHVKLLNNDNIIEE